MIGREIFYEPISLTTDKTRFLEESGPKINYSSSRLTADEFFIRNHPLLFETGIREQKVDCFSASGQVAFFETGGDFPFDIFAASFYLLSRYEEWLPFKPDKYGRFPYHTSLAFRENFLDIPLVNYWLEHFKKRLQEKFPELLFRIKDFKIIPSYDIDIAYSYKYKGLFRNAGGFARSLLKGEWARLLDRWDVLFQ
ncbi:MAG TPA: hypothetical protein VGM24_13090, partial [Puia sp.]